MSTLTKANIDESIVTDVAQALYFEKNFYTAMHKKEIKLIELDKHLSESLKEGDR